MFSVEFLVRDFGPRAMSVMLGSSCSLWIIFVLGFVLLISANPEGICFLNLSGFVLIRMEVILPTLGFVFVLRFDAVDKMTIRM